MYEGRLKVMLKVMLKVILLLQVSSHDFEPTFIIFCLNWRILPDQPNKKQNNKPLTCNKHLSLLYFWHSSSSKILNGKVFNLIASGFRVLKSNIWSCAQQFCISCCFWTDVVELELVRLSWSDYIWLDHTCRVTCQMSNQSNGVKNCQFCGFGVNYII